MNRKYTIEEFIEIIEKLRKVSPDCAITTDIITGHPGENDEEFKNIIENVKKIDFAKLHVFPYSVRQNTKSANLPQVPEYLKKDHTDALLKLSYELENKYMKKFTGKVLDVLFETSKDGYSYGHTTNYIHVKVIGKVPSSSIKPVRLINVEYPYCFGELVEDED